MDKKIEAKITRDVKIMLLTIIKKGIITQNDVNELGKMVGIVAETLTIKVIHNREELENDTE